MTGFYMERKIGLKLVKLNQFSLVGDNLETPRKRVEFGNRPKQYFQLRRKDERATIIS